MMEASEIKQRLKPFKLFINGRWEGALSGRTIPVTIPATGATLTSVPDAGPEDVDRAVKAARLSCETGAWRKMNVSEREKIIWRIGELIDKNKEELGMLESLNNGKTYREALRGDIPPTADIFYYCAGWTRKIYGKTIPVDGNYLNYTLREPVGVVGMITAWNYPLLLAAWKVAPALATGCSMVIKPSELTPLTTLKLAEYCLEAGVPEGVVNVVTGYGPPAGERQAAQRPIPCDRAPDRGHDRNRLAFVVRTRRRHRAPAEARPSPVPCRQQIERLLRSRQRHGPSCPHRSERPRSRAAGRFRRR